ncbi:MAG: hypothetical protein WAS21_18385, partial [Geminicoccaceae bacterium]
MKPELLSPKVNVPTNTAARRHRDDIMSAEKRSAVMVRIKGRSTGPERALAALLSGAGVPFDALIRLVDGVPIGA